MKAVVEFLIGVLTVIFMFVAVVFVIGMLGVLFVIALIVWGCGVPITIKQEGRVLGYVRWFTYYTEQQWLMHKFKTR